MHDINKILDKEIEGMFPTTGKWYSSCFKKPNELIEENLPCHLRDDKWLADYIIKKYHHFFARRSDIIDYMHKSEVFNKLRHDYEQRIVSWQIDWMNSNGENWKCEDDLYMFSTRCDEIFRNGIVNTLLAIGMSKDAIEEGIETNSDKWLEMYMKTAFRNQYNPIFFWADSHVDKLEAPAPEHYTLWRQLRLYNYYNQHKDSIHKYGKVLPQMKMTKEEAKEVKQWLDEEHKKRMQQIQDYKTDSLLIKFDGIIPDDLKPKTKNKNLFKIVNFK